MEGAIKDAKNEEYHVPNATEEDVRAVTEGRDEYLAVNVFFVPEEVRWEYLMACAMQPDIGKVIDRAMAAIERQNPKQLRGVLPRIYASAGVPAQALGELINLFSSIDFGDDYEGSAEKDVLA